MPLTAHRVPRYGPRGETTPARRRLYHRSRARAGTLPAPAGQRTRSPPRRDGPVTRGRGPLPSPQGVVEHPRADLLSGNGCRWAKRPAQLYPAGGYGATTRTTSVMYGSRVNSTG